MMEQTGLAWDVQRVSSEEMELKRVAERAPAERLASWGLRSAALVRSQPGYAT